MLLALLLFFTPAISANVEDHWRDELAALHRKLDQLREDLVTVTPADDSTPEDARRSLQSIDTSKHIGLEIRQEKSIVTLGKNKDIKFIRYGANKLLLDANVKMTGSLELLNKKSGVGAQLASMQGFETRLKTLEASLKALDSSVKVTSGLLKSFGNRLAKVESAGGGGSGKTPPKGSVEALARRVSAIEDAGTCKEEDDAVFSQISKQFAQFGNKDNIASKSYTIKLLHGYSVVLKGWTHTRSYHLGFLRNTKGAATATISGLKPGHKYAFAIWQWATHANNQKINPWTVNGQGPYRTAAQPDKSDTHEPTASDIVYADNSGKIVFTFQHSSGHVVLSGLSISKLCAKTCIKQERPNFAQITKEFSQFGNKDNIASKSYTINLRYGRTVVLKGWTHTRDYHLGFLRNTKGTATATVSGLTPRHKYSFSLWQWATHANNQKVNPWTVNGQGPYNTAAMPDRSANAPPTATDTVYADADGQLKFTFTHSSGHLVLSGLSITLACESTYYATYKQLQQVVQRVATVEAASSCEDENQATFGQVTKEFAQFSNKDNIASKSYTVKLLHGYTAVLTGWTHTRTYHLGFLRNTGGKSYATISGLKPGQKYQFAVWQWATHANNQKVNPWTVNGQGPYRTAAQKDKSSKHPPTALDIVYADSSGKIKFTFLHSSGHLVLSGLSIAKLCTNSCVKQPDASFSAVNSQFAKFGNKDNIASNSYSIDLLHGRTAVMKGWTHTRTYHQGFLRNIKGQATVTVSGLTPGQKYKFMIWQWAANAANQKVNPWTVNQQGPYNTKAKSDGKKSPTAVDFVHADVSGNIVFTFTHSSGHVVFTGLSLALACETNYFAADKDLKSLEKRVVKLEKK